MKRFRFSPLMLRPALAIALIIAAALPATAQTPKSGGSLNVMLREDLPQGFAIHEASTYSTSFPALPCFNNLVFFDPAKPTESMDTIVGDLAERWSWQDNYKNLVFFLRKDVKWHDGKPFTSKDVKFTFDMLREASDAPAKLRINPRKDWYANIEHIEAADPYTVVFRMKRPQPALLMMLASGYTPGLCGPYPARAIPHELHRHRPVQAQGVAPRRVRRVREEPRLLRQGPAVSRRAQVRGDRRARHPDGGAPGRAARYRLPR